MILIGLSNSKLLARDVARRLNVDYFNLELRHSVDGEMHMKFEQEVKGKTVFLFQSFYPHQNSSLIEVLFAATHARDLGAKEIVLVAPYLSYIREDFRNSKFECVSVKILGELLSGCLDEVISIDPHLYDVKKYFTIPFHSLSTVDLIRDYVKNYDVIVGPDENSRRFVLELGKQYVILNKKRKNEFDVRFKGGHNLEGKKVVVVDDMAITGCSIIGCVNHLNLKNVDCVVVHPVFVGNAYDEISKNVNKVISCNTIEDNSNDIDVSGIIARKIKNEWY
jgi:ribose-phosphate pyrophosphokinase